MKHNSIDELIESLVNARRAKKLTQSEMAKRMGFPQSYLSRLENGKLDIRISTLIDIARYLNLELILAPDTMAETIKTLIAPENVSGTAKAIYNLDDADEEGG
jgi:transcriptional regulator with XRE-family HTH domain